MKNKFSEHEWFLLSSTPAAVGALMSAAAPSGVLGTIKELSASMKTTVHGLQSHGDSELIAALLERADNWGEAKEKASDYGARTKQRFSENDVSNAADLRALVLKDCETVAGLVDERVNETEAASYKDWCATIAMKVAQASKEGSILGIGGTRVSEDEMALMSQIENALGIANGKLLTVS